MLKQLMFERLKSLSRRGHESDSLFHIYEKAMNYELLLKIYPKN